MVQTKKNKKYFKKNEQEKELISFEEEEETKVKQYEKAITFKTEAELVRCMALAGVDTDRICKVIKKSKRDLYALYKEELKNAKAVASAAIARSILREGLTGSQADRIFYAKTQLGWRETSKVELDGNVNVNLSINIAGMGETKKITGG